MGTSSGGGVKKEKGEKLWFRAVLILLPRLVSLYFKLVDLTSKKVFLNQEHEESVCKKRPFACAVFHGTMLYPVYYCRRYPGVVMVSRSWDGELISRCLRHWGYDTTRGSSSRGGREALSQALQLIKEKNYCSGLAVDAPRGPSRQVKLGIVILARDAEHPIVPAVSWCTRQIQFNSWDRMILPLPFSTIVMAFGTPREVPKDLPRKRYGEIRREIEEDMLLISQQAEEEVRTLKSGRR